MCRGENVNVNMLGTQNANCTVQTTHDTVCVLYMHTTVAHCTVYLYTDPTHHTHATNPPKGQ